VIVGDRVGEEIFNREERTGIARDRARRSVREGLLYSIEYIRLKQGTGLFAQFDGTKLMPDSGHISLGGDHRPAHYQPAQTPKLNPEKIKTGIASTKRFKLVLTAPTLFVNGWCPKWIDRRTLEGSRDHVRVKLIAAALGKFTGIGGFDLVKQHPKPIHRFAPAGSVYFFELLEGNADTVLQTFHEKSISEDIQTFPQTARQGFGHSLIGGW
jgi:CRISPR-associated protein Cmr3